MDKVGYRLGFFLDQSGDQPETGTFLATPWLWYPYSNPCARFGVLPCLENRGKETVWARAGDAIPASDTIIL